MNRHKIVMLMLMASTLLSLMVGVFVNPLILACAFFTGSLLLKIM